MGDKIANGLNTPESSLGGSESDSSSSGKAKLILGVGGVIGVYWVFESVMQFWLTTNPSFWGIILGADIYETLRRITVLVFFAVLASHVQYSLERTEKAELALRAAREEEAKLQMLAMSLSTELNLNRLLHKILDISTDMLDAERGTLFMYDEKSRQLKSLIAQGMDEVGITLPSNLGIAGTTFSTGNTINISNVYKDKRFWPELDRVTGFKTTSVLSVPVRNKQGKPIGVLEILNKKKGAFTKVDEKRLEVFSAHVSVAIENAALFDDVLNLKNYSESMLNSMSNGVISIDSNRKIVKHNTAALEIVGVGADELENHPASEFFDPWMIRGIEVSMRTGREYVAMDTEIPMKDGSSASVNLTAVPLKDAKNELIGALILLEDVTSEKRLKGTLARYMTKEVADKLMEGGDTALGGVTQEATVLFSDIQGFTSIAEQLDPQDAVTLLNDYFTLMVDVVFKHKGILDKYIGDGLMAVFGAPVATDLDTDNAVLAAIDMMSALDVFNRERENEGMPPISIRIGVNTDEILSGNIGSIKRMDYTVIGDGVNLAFRLEQANKFYRTNILVSEFTYSRLKRTYLTRKVDQIRAKGKTKPVTIYQIMDYFDEETFPHLLEVVHLFNQGLERFQERDWGGSAGFFERALDLNPEDFPSSLYLDRSRYYSKQPPDKEWDGIWAMEDLETTQMILPPESNSA